MHNSHCDGSKTVAHCRLAQRLRRTPSLHLRMAGTRRGGLLPASKRPSPSNSLRSVRPSRERRQCLFRDGGFPSEPGLHRPHESGQRRSFEYLALSANSALKRRRTRTCEVGVQVGLM